MLSALSIKSLSILIIIVKKYSCLVILTFSPYLTLVLTLVQFLPIDFLFFCLLVCLVIFLNVVQDVLGSRTAVIKPLIMQWQGKGGEKHFIVL